MLAEFTKTDYSSKREDLRKTEKQKKIIYQKIAIMLSMKNIHDITRDKLEVMLRKSDVFTDGELDLVFGKSTILKEQKEDYFKEIDYSYVAEEDISPAYLRARELKKEREESVANKFGMIPEYI